MKKDRKRFLLSAISYKLKAVSSGFGLVELLVALAIFGIVTTFVILAYGRVNSELRTTSLAYEIALSFREAQSYGVSVRAVGGDEEALTPESLESAYGLHFEADIDPESGISIARNYYTLFVDTRRDRDSAPVGETAQTKRYDGYEDESGCRLDTECVSVFKIDHGNSITRFCGVLSNDTEDCNVNHTSGFTIVKLDVLFQRPNPDAIIATDLSSREPNRYKAARIYLQSAKVKERVVEVGTTGQITIK